jgi:hypothetical protein
MVPSTLPVFPEDPPEPLDRLIEGRTEVIALASGGDSPRTVHMHDDLDLASPSLVGVDDLSVRGAPLELRQRSDLAFGTGEHGSRDVAMPLGDGDPHVPTFALKWNPLVLRWKATQGA